MASIIEPLAYDMYQTMLALGPRKHITQIVDAMVAQPAYAAFACSGRCQRGDHRQRAGTLHADHILFSRAQRAMIWLRKRGHAQMFDKGGPGFTYSVIAKS